MKTIITILLAFTVLAAAAQNQPANRKQGTGVHTQKMPVAPVNDTITLTLKIPAGMVYNFLVVQTANVDTLSNVSAKQVNTIIKPGAQAVSNYVLQSFDRAFAEWAKAKQAITVKKPK